MLELTVSDMTCSHCAATITRAVQGVDGTARCEIDLGAKRVRIESERPAEHFVSAIRQAGYTPR